MFEVQTTESPPSIQECLQGEWPPAYPCHVRHSVRPTSSTLSYLQHAKVNGLFYAFYLNSSYYYYYWLAPSLFVVCRVFEALAAIIPRSIAINIFVRSP